MCDDGSTDGTAHVVRRVFEGANGPTEVRLVSTDRVGGVTANFERAVRACRGEIIALCDQDDVWHPDRLAAVLPWFRDSGARSLVFCDATLINEAGAKMGGTLHDRLRIGSRERRRIDNGAAFEVLIRRNVVTGAATTFSRDLLQLALPFPPDWVHDEWLAIIAAASGEVRRSDKTLIDYRLHADNQIGVSDPSISARLARMLEPRGDRYLRLSRRSRELADRLATLDVEPRKLKLARRKQAFESARAAYPQSRLRRILPVLRRWFRGDYARLSSQRNLDVVRDLLQPP